MQSCANSRKLKIIVNFFIFKSLFDFLFKNNKFILHLWIDVSFFIRWPKSPKSITNNISKSGFLFFSKNIFSQLNQDLLPLHQLQSLLLLIFLISLTIVFACSNFFHCVVQSWYHHFLVSILILQYKLFNSILLFVVLLAPVIWRFLRF